MVNELPTHKKIMSARDKIGVKLGDISGAIANTRINARRVRICMMQGDATTTMRSEIR